VALAPFGCPVRPSVAFSGQGALGRRLPSGFEPAIAIIGRDQGPATRGRRAAEHEGATQGVLHLFGCSVDREHCQFPFVRCGAACAAKFDVSTSSVSTAKVVSTSMPRIATVFIRARLANSDPLTVCSESHPVAAFACSLQARRRARAAGKRMSSRFNVSRQRTVGLSALPSWTLLARNFPRSSR